MKPSFFEYFSAGSLVLLAALPVTAQPLIGTSGTIARHNIQAIVSQSSIADCRLNQECDLNPPVDADFVYGRCPSNGRHTHALQWEPGEVVLRVRNCEVVSLEVRVDE